MDNGYTKRIRERVLSLEDGTVFVTSDFADIADTSTIHPEVYCILAFHKLLSKYGAMFLTALNGLNFDE